jgi:MtN3 and saliva related transmembrane protein
VIAAVGMVAALMTTGAWIPQLWRTWSTRSANDLSWTYLAVTVTSMGTWLTYGVLAGDLAVIATNIVTSALVTVLAALKVRVS